MERQRGTIWYCDYIVEFSVLHRNYYHSSEKQCSHITWPVFGCIWQKGFKEKQTTTLRGWQYTSFRGFGTQEPCFGFPLSNKWAARPSDPARTGLCLCLWITWQGQISSHADWHEFHMLKLQKHVMSSFGNHNHSSPKEAQNQENTIRASSATHHSLLAHGALTPQPTSEHDFFLLWLIASRSLHSRAHCKYLCTQLTR